MFLWIEVIYSAYSWGFWAHQRINRLAVFTLPSEMIPFYKAHIEFITEHATDPDSRRYAVNYEAPRHFIDIDHYGKYPFLNVPRRWEDAKALYTEDTLLTYGIVPWHIQVSLSQLTKAFEQKDLEKILKYSAELGHYVGDAHVPLHTTENYNGQLTGQKGIHGFWESRLPELFGEKYNFFVGKAYFIQNPLEEAWNTVLESHAALDSVLSFERELTKIFPPDKKYSFENRNGILVKVYSEAFSREYHNRLNGQVERRMRKAILRIGSFWRTAWERAGKPDLTELAKKKLSPAQLKAIEEEQATWRKNAQNPNPKDRESTVIQLIGKVDYPAHQHECCVVEHHQSRVKLGRTEESSFFCKILLVLIFWIYYLIF
ncbi:MAG: zinc dependent phospholipase C family protein [Bacteroidia bacterium]|nr:zinc dependent phospholipase C family protein [Bacteroidia bacterium]